MGVDEARRDQRVAIVLDGDALWDLCIIERADRSDAPALGDDQRVVVDGQGLLAGVEEGI